MIEFARPWLLAWLIGVVAWLWRRRQGGDRIPVSDLTVAGQVARHRWWPRVPVLLRALAIMALVVAAAGPRLGERTLRIRGEGIAIALAIDVSSSMLAEDFAPSNRLEVAKRQAVGFIRGRRADRIGLVAFAGEALTQVPLTLDYGVLEEAVVAHRVSGKSRVVLLLTDGENNRGAVDPRTAAEAARTMGVRVYTIGVGTEGEARVPTGRGLSGLRYETVPVRIDEELLRSIADRTGGRYFRATDGAALERIFRQIDALERTTQSQDLSANRDESTRPFVAMALLFLAVELVVGATRVVRVP
jgi:Ca-activated chloride channel family protein